MTGEVGPTAGSKWAHAAVAIAFVTAGVALILNGEACWGGGLIIAGLCVTF